MKRSFTVTLEMPEDTTLEDVEDYISDAVASWCKSYDPESDPLFYINGDSVRVKARRRHTVKRDPLNQGG